MDKMNSIIGRVSLTPQSTFVFDDSLPPFDGKRYLLQVNGNLDMDGQLFIDGEWNAGFHMFVTKARKFTIGQIIGWQELPTPAPETSLGDAHGFYITRTVTHAGDRLNSTPVRFDQTSDIHKVKTLYELYVPNVNSLLSSMSLLKKYNKKILAETPSSTVEFFIENIECEPPSSQKPVRLSSVGDLLVLMGVPNPIEELKNNSVVPKTTTVKFTPQYVGPGDASS